MPPSTAKYTNAKTDALKNAKDAMCTTVSSGKMGKIGEEDNSTKKDSDATTEKGTLSNAEGELEGKKAKTPDTAKQTCFGSYCTNRRYYCRHATSGQRWLRRKCSTKN